MSDKIKPSEVSQVLLEQLKGISDSAKFDEVEQISHMSRTDERDCLYVCTLLGKRLREETAVTVPHQEHGQVVLRFEPLAEEQLVLEGLFEYIAGVLAAVLVGFGESVCAVVVAEHYVASLVEVARKLVVATRILAHTVQELNDAFGILHVVPKPAINLGVVKTFEFELSHMRSPQKQGFIKHIIYNKTHFFNSSFEKYSDKNCKNRCVVLHCFYASINRSKLRKRNKAQNQR